MRKKKCQYSVKFQKYSLKFVSLLFCLLHIFEHEQHEQAIERVPEPERHTEHVDVSARALVRGLFHPERHFVQQGEPGGQVPQKVLREVHAGEILVPQGQNE